jgi:hypothetical protein
VTLHRAPDVGACRVRQLHLVRLMAVDIPRKCIGHRIHRRAPVRVIHFVLAREVTR